GLLSSLSRLSLDISWPVLPPGGCLSFSGVHAKEERMPATQTGFFLLSPPLEQGKLLNWASHGMESATAGRGAGRLIPSLASSRMTCFRLRPTARPMRAGRNPWPWRSSTCARTSGFLGPCARSFTWSRLPLRGFDLFGGDRYGQNLRNGIAPRRKNITVRQ